MVAGKVAITFDGDWIDDKPYDRLVAVRYNGNCYISKKESTGIEPTNEEYWFLAVKGGASVATNDKAGIVKPDGITIMIDEDGTIRSVGMTDIPIASGESLGGVIVGDGIEVDENGKISVPIDNSLSLESENAVQNKAVMGYVSQLSNPNLLINPDFKINQRGQTEYPVGRGSAYTVDRWQGNTSVTSVTLTDKGVMVNGTNENAFVQFIENPERFNGMTMTFTAKVSNYDELTYLSYGYGDSAFNIPITNDIMSVTFTVDLTWENFFVGFRPNAGTPLNIEWAKLEVGEVATPFTPPDYGTELLRCQRYYESAVTYFNHGNNNVIGDGVEGVVFYKATKRIPPTVTATLLENVRGLNGLIVGTAGVNENQFRVFGAATEAAVFFEFTWIADAEIY